MIATGVASIAGRAKAARASNGARVMPQKLGSISKETKGTVFWLLFESGLFPLLTFPA